MLKPISWGTAKHTITDFETGIDKLDISQCSDITEASIPTAVQQGSDALITLDAHVLKNVVASSLHATDFLVHA